MLSKCANPSCSTRFLYLREGKLFHLAPPGNSRSMSDSRDWTGGERRPEYYWLCNVCATSLTLAFDKRTGMILVPLQNAAMGQQATPAHGAMDLKPT
jgi:hypothetical protein